VPTCANCGEENGPRARFCQACGSSLAGAAGARRSRKIVTVLFCDLVDSTPLGERLDPEILRMVMSRYFDAMREPLERHGGTVEKFVGDAVMAVFGIPKVHEDDALRAIRAATEMREALGPLNEELRERPGVEIQIRIGINTGDVMAGDLGGDVPVATGDTMNVAARLEQSAAPGQIVIAAETYRLVQDAVLVDGLDPISLKGKSAPVAAYRLREVIAGVEGRTRRLDSPMVGRIRPLNLLLQAYEGASADRTCQLVTILGTAGVGKSRLVEEFVGAVGPAAVARGHCPPYGEGISLAPVLEAARQATGLTELETPDAVRTNLTTLLAGDDEGPTVAERIAQLLAGGEGASQEDTFWAIRRFFGALARDRTLVLVFDDIQWGESMFLDLLEHVADWSRDAAIVLVAMARPELLELRPGWGGGKQNAAAITLEPLSTEECDALIANLLGAAEIDEDTRRRITDAAGGTPLFVEEMLAKLIDDDLLVRDGDRWVAAGDLSEVPVPPTITALLAARIDRLTDGERAVLERAAIAGDAFFAGAVRRLSPEGDGDHLDGDLLGLVRKDLIRPMSSTIPGQDAFRFRHLLIRDAVYDAMPKELRAQLHGAFADWLQAVAGDATGEQDEAVGFHLEQMNRFREELGLDADPAAAHRAGTLLAAAGRRAVSRVDFSAAMTLLNRAAQQLPEDDPERARVLGELGATLNRVGRNVDAERTLSEAIQLADRSGEIVVATRARLDRLWTSLELDTEAFQRGLRDGEVERYLQILRDRDDDLGITKALQLLAWRDGLSFRYEQEQVLLDEALIHARRAGDRLEESEILVELLEGALWGPTPVEEAFRRCDEIAGPAARDRRIEGARLGVRSILEAMCGRFDEARAIAAQVEVAYRETGVEFVWVEASIRWWFVEMLAGRPDEAERRMASAGVGRIEIDRTGEWLIDSLRAQAISDQGRFHEARRLAEVCIRTDGPWLLGKVVSRTGLAKALSGLGDQAAGEDLARETVDMIASTDAIAMHGDALMNLAWVLDHGGGTQGAIRSAEEALALYERKGDLASAAKARTWIAARMPSR